MGRRIQLSRQRGARKPDTAINVARPGPFGNPFPVGKEGPLGRVAPDRAGAVGLFEQMLDDPEMREACGYPSDAQIKTLAGRSLACWCPLSEPCHADILMERAKRLAAKEG